MRYSSLSEKGRRPNNEDVVFTRFDPRYPLLAAVSDGMGGHAAGEIASRMSIEALDTWTRDSRTRTLRGDPGSEPTGDSSTGQARTCTGSHTTCHRQDEDCTQRGREARAGARPVLVPEHHGPQEPCTTAPSMLICGQMRPREKTTGNDCPRILHRSTGGRSIK